MASGRHACLVSRLAATCLIVLGCAGRTSASDFFGPSEGLQLQPEFDYIHSIGESFRIIGRIEPTFVPSQGSDTMGFSLYGSWMVAPYTDELISPDLVKRKRFDVRVGISWYPVVVAGTGSWSNELRLETEGTGRSLVPGGILATVRGRVEAQWQLDEPTGFTWRLRARPQLEREFVLSGDAGSSLTPFLNVEFIWTTAHDMWAQFRMQAGLQLGARWFGAGQVIELNGSIVTYLQPARSHAPVIGLVWYQYF